MQTADLVLAIAVPLVALLAGWVGVEMTLTPPEKQTPEMRRRYRAAFVFLMAAAIGLNIWQTARNAKQQDDARVDSQRKQGELSSKVSEQSGKLDAIAHFESQFLTLVSQSQRPATGTPDAATKAYEAMALSVMKMAQGTPSSAAADVHLRVTYGNSELNGQTIDVATAYNTQNGKPIPNSQQNFSLSEFHITNYGSHLSGAVTARLYLSKPAQSSFYGWQLTQSEEANYPSAFYLTNNGPIYINAQETWNFPGFSGALQWDTNDSISAMLKVFYGADRPVIVHFTIRKKS